MESSELIDEGEAAAIYARLLTLEGNWHRVRKGFFTLGSPTWLGRPVPPLAHNELLRTHFGPLLETLRAHLSTLLGAPVEFLRELSLPGFHVFRSIDGEDPTGKPASIHSDWATLLAGLSRALVGTGPLQVADTVSFTLAIKLPASGSGLMFWPDLTGDAVGALATGHGVVGEAAMAHLVGRHDASFTAYRVGSMVRHNGQVVHWIPPLESVRKGDERVTLQGHGIFRKGRWNVFW
jgi:hypothetical protein